MRSFNLRQVKLRSGEEYRDEVELELEPFELGGERYLPVPGTVPAALAITKASTGTLFELTFTTRLPGPCYRSLDLAGWSRDAVALAPPDKILCRDDGAGLCPVCGKNLNYEPHTHEEERGD